MSYKLTKKALYLDLHAAFITAKKHKSSKAYVRHFEKDLDKNLWSLCEDLYNKTYTPEPSSCFIVERPKKREVFAAQFRDRVVHHLYFNYTNKIFERTFIQDTYSCIKNRGTHYGIRRLAKHIRQESRNYTRECYVLKLDKRGYFMHINRQRLVEIATKTLLNMRYHKISKHGTQIWNDIIDFDFVIWLTKEIALLEPKNQCKVVGRESDWEGLDKSKSLFYTPEGCGIPIGNLTSQLFSNVYLNEFDQYVKRELRCKHYGRYVDDSYVVSCDKQFLLSIVPPMRKFLKEQLGLDLHMGKLQIIRAKYGVEFLGGFVKPFRLYVSNATLKRTRKNILKLKWGDKESVFRSVNSFLGTLVHYCTYKIRHKMFFRKCFLSVGTFNESITKLSRNSFTLNKS